MHFESNVLSLVSSDIINFKLNPSLSFNIFAFSLFFIIKINLLSSIYFSSIFPAKIVIVS